jgi:cytosine/adenosine deaminase-related metal-dependent hydrolase
VQDEAFRSVAELAADEPLSIHFMESPDEAALYSGEGSLAAWYERMGWRCDFLHYGSPAKRITGSLSEDKRLMLVHNCCVAEEDIELINNHFVNPVAWVLCPRSNDYISGLKPPVELLRRHSDMICVGTDSLASNDSLSIIEELKMFEGVPLAEVVKWATINGARALGVEKEIGSVEVGKRPGLVLIEGVEYADGLRLTPHSTSRRII